jgi:hypothetical protein
MTDLVWLAVRDRHMPRKIIGFLRIRADAAKKGDLAVWIAQDVDDEVNVHTMSMLRARVESYREASGAELAVFTGDIPTETWRKAPGFFEIPAKEGNADGR